MGVSYPNTVWDGDSVNRDSDNAPRKSPDHRDWARVQDELIATQTRVDANNAGRDDDTLDTVGTAATKTGLSVAEKGDGAVHKTIFTFTAMSLASVIGTNDRPYGSQALYTFPDGHILIHSVHMQFPLGDIECVNGAGLGFSSTADIEIGIGTALTTDTADNGLDGSTEEDVLGAVVIALTAKTSASIEKDIDSTPEVIDGHGSGKTYYLNFRAIGADDHGVAVDALLFSGTFTILWSNLGDNG